MNLKLMVSTLLRSYVSDKKSNNQITRIAKRTGLRRKTVYNIIGQKDYKISSLLRLLKEIDKEQKIKIIIDEN